MTLNYVTRPFYRREVWLGTLMWIAVAAMAGGIVFAWTVHAYAGIAISLAAYLFIKFPLKRSLQIVYARHARATDHWQGMRFVRNYSGTIYWDGKQKLRKVHGSLNAYVREW